MAQFFEDWGDKTVAAGVPTGWSRLFGNTTGTWSVESVAGLSGKVLRLTGVGGGAGGLGLDAAGTPAVQQVFLMFSFTGEDAINNSRTVGPALRADATGVTYYENALRHPIATGTRAAQVNRRSVFDGFAAVGNETFSYAESTVYALLAEADGTTVRLKVWAPASLSDPGADEPATWTVSGTDSAIASGVPGIAATEAAAAVFDVFAVGIGTAGDPAPLAADILASPAGFTHTATGLQLDGAWSAVAGTTVTYDWEVERDDAGTWVAFDSGITAPLAFQVTTGVAYATTYRARVRTDDGGVKSEWTGYVSATTPADALAISGTQSEAVSLSWTTATSPYDIRRDGVTIIVSGLTGTTYVDTDVTAGTTYSYEVRSDGGAWSEPITVAVVDGGGGVFFLKRVGSAWTT